MSRRKLTLIIFGILLLALIGPFVAITRDSSQPETRVHELDLASVAAKNFLDTFVRPDGQVGDNGLRDDLQVQGMLIAAATADRARFDSIAAAYGSIGRYADIGAPTEDDLVLARALIVASERLGDPKYADSVKQALAARAPSLPDPQKSTASAVQLRTFAELADLTGDARWNETANAFRTRLRTELDSHRLPADEPSFDSYSASAQMVPLWLLDSCNAEDTDLAKKIWLGLRDSKTTRVASALSLDSESSDDEPSARAAAATAAAAEAAGEYVQADQLLEQADVIAKNKGDAESVASAALGRIVVSTDWLGVC
jgi:hypothetical protein